MTDSNDEDPAMVKQGPIGHQAPGPHESSAIGMLHVPHNIVTQLSVAAVTFRMKAFVAQLEESIREVKALMEETMKEVRASLEKTEAKTEELKALSEGAEASITALAKDLGTLNERINRLFVSKYMGQQATWASQEMLTGLEIGRGGRL